MDELELLTRMRAEVPQAEVSPQDVDHFLTALQDRFVPRRYGRIGRLRLARAWNGPRLSLRVTLTAGVAASVAAGATIALTSGHQAAPAERTGLTAEVLGNRAAAAALATPAPRPGQWVYRQSTCQDFMLIGPNGVPCDGPTEQTWSTPDASKVIYLYGGPLVTSPFRHLPPPPPEPPPPSVAIYRARATLPRDPRALVVYINRYGSGSQASRDAETLSTIGDLLANYVDTPALTAEQYHALADTPGVRADVNAVDVAGRHGTGFFLQAPRTGGDLTNSAVEVIVNPRTYQFMGLKQWNWTVGSPMNSKNNSSLNSTALLREAFVSGPGVQP